MEVPTIKEESFIDDETNNNKKSVDLDNDTRIKINKLLPINKLPSIKKAKLVAKEPPAGMKWSTSEWEIYFVWISKKLKRREYEKREKSRRLRMSISIDRDRKGRGKRAKRSICPWCLVSKTSVRCLWTRSFIASIARICAMKPI